MHSLITEYNLIAPERIKLRQKLLSLILNTGQNCYVESPVNLVCPDNINLSNNVYLNHHVTLEAPSLIYIEKDVLIGPHTVVSALYRHSLEHSEVTIEQGVWIGAHCKIYGGVIIGKGSIVAAGSSVESSIPPNVIAAGSPAKIVKNL